MRDKEPEFEDVREKHFEAPRLGSHGVWCFVSFVLFLVKPFSESLVLYCTKD